MRGRLVATHYPHHCLVGDWLDEELSGVVASAGAPTLHATSCSVGDFSKGIYICVLCFFSELLYTTMTLI